MYRHQLIEVEAKIAPDPAVGELIRQALAPYQGELSTVVGETATALNRGTTLETTMDNCSCARPPDVAFLILL
jgi:2',3'-cyclic-nucleotide 2'-phosphodiesterase (5'-nucleotidase family)